LPVVSLPPSSFGLHSSLERQSRRASDFAGAVDLPLPWGVADVDACLPPRL
jgi:hypothetical protein